MGSQCSTLGSAPLQVDGRHRLGHPVVAGDGQHLVGAVAEQAAVVVQQHRLAQPEALHGAVAVVEVDDVGLLGEAADLGLGVLFQVMSRGKSK